MTHDKLIVQLQAQVDSELITINLVEDKDVPNNSIYVNGYFNPFFIVDNSDAIEIDIQVNTIGDANLTDDEWKHLNSEFIRTVNHELVHFEQLKDGRFIPDWDGDYKDNPNEIEAYARENSGVIGEPVSKISAWLILLNKCKEY